MYKTYNQRYDNYGIPIPACNTPERFRYDYISDEEYEKLTDEQKIHWKKVIDKGE